MAVPRMTRKIARGVGKTAWWSTKPARAAGSAAGRRVMAGGKGATGVVLGGAAVLGAGSAIMDREGRYGDLQEQAFGDRDAIRYSMKAGLKTAFDPSTQYDRQGPMDYYYGRPVDPSAIFSRRSSGSTTPVSGDTVFGMFNLRKG